MFVCDSYHAMISERPFGEARSEDDALGELSACAASQFDPRVVEAFLAEILAGDSAGCDASQAHAA